MPLLLTVTRDKLWGPESRGRGPVGALVSVVQAVPAQEAPPGTCGCSGYCPWGPCRLRREGLLPCPLRPPAPEGNRNASCLFTLSSAASPT